MTIWTHVVTAQMPGGIELAISRHKSERAAEAYASKLRGIIRKRGGLFMHRFIWTRETVLRVAPYQKPGTEVKKSAG